MAFSVGGTRGDPPQKRILKVLKSTTRDPGLLTLRVIMVEATLLMVTPSLSMVCMALIESKVFSITWLPCTWVIAYMAKVPRDETLEQSGPHTFLLLIRMAASVPVAC